MLHILKQITDNRTIYIIRHSNKVSISLSKGGYLPSIVLCCFEVLTYSMKISVTRGSLPNSRIAKLLPVKITYFEYKSTKLQINYLLVSFETPYTIKIYLSKNSI